MRRVTLLLLLIALLAIAGCSGRDAPTVVDDQWRVEVVADGLDHPWGLAEFPDGELLVTERAGRIVIVADGTVRAVDADTADVQANGEGGLMGLELSPTFTDDRTFFVCMATTAGDVQIIPFQLSEDGASAARRPALVTAITLNPSGRHSGCRLRVGADGMLYAGVGDSARGSAPQDLATLGGKVLRVDPATGQPPPDNPFVASDDPRTRLIFSYGHRNVQGLAVQPDTGAIYGAEHGPDVDDEVNLLKPGANYGWNPVGSGSYDESKPMTDMTIDGVVSAVWSSGSPTIAASGCAFLQGSAWGEREGWLAIAALKGSALYLLDVTNAGGGKIAKAAVLDGDYGRLRTVELADDASLLVTTSNGGNDKILRLRP